MPELVAREAERFAFAPVASFNESLCPLSARGVWAMGARNRPVQILEYRQYGNLKKSVTCRSCFKTFGGIIGSRKLVRPLVQICTTPDIRVCQTLQADRGLRVGGRVKI